MLITDFKHCARCKAHKLRTEFGRNWQAKDGLQGYCKPCMGTYRDARRKALRSSVEVASIPRETSEVV